MNGDIENPLPNGSVMERTDAERVNSVDNLHVSPSHSSTKYISPHIGNISKGDRKYIRYFIVC